jgi:rSAM/selenodomain-associated transferase 1
VSAAGTRRRGARSHARRPRVAIVVLAKHPVAGRVKTRLAATIGAPASCALYRGFVRDLAARLARMRVPVWWAFTPSTAPFARLVGTRRCFAQRGTDLGRRIHHAIESVHRTSGGPVIALGADMPHVARREIERAGRALAREADVVLGPADDGGYYLLGVRVPERGLFVDVAWGTADVAAATRRRCRALGLSLVELAAGFDVDGIRELAALARIARRRPREYRHTRAALRRLTRRGGSLPLAASPSSGCGRR